ncbi:MAG TPA: rod-binding protein [Spirochaetota bacterium]|nr:rod-binding protein [Spirochaetota bacterium]HQH98883.1 rod-binding protein [Spirochaetota bacterium]
MIAQGTTPLAGLQVRDEDIVSKLVRVPAKAASAEDEKVGASFSSVLSKSVREGGSGPAAVKPKRAAQEKRLWDACIEMESLLVGKMLKEMRKTVQKTGWMNGGFAEEIFEDMLYDEYAMSLSRNSNLGMAKMLYDELKRNV